MTKAQQYLHLAGQYRALAEVSADDDTREFRYSMARLLERMAEQAERKEPEP